MLLQTNVAPNGFCAKLKPENTKTEFMLQSQNSSFLASSCHEPRKDLKIFATSTLAWGCSGINTLLLPQQVCLLCGTVSLSLFGGSSHSTSLKLCNQEFLFSQPLTLTLSFCVSLGHLMAPCRSTAKHTGPTSTSQLCVLLTPPFLL